MVSVTCSKCHSKPRHKKDTSYCQSCRATCNKKYFFAGQHITQIKEKIKKFTNHKYRLFISSKCNAITKGLEHTISMQDIILPEICPFLGISLNYHAKGNTGKGPRHWDAPSIDRIDSTKGYIPGNIQVISDLANKMKQNATPEQLVAFAKGILKMYG